MKRIYKYGYLGRRPGLIQAILTLIFFVPLPYWAYLIFDVQIQTVAVYFTLIIGAIVILDSIYADKRLHDLFQSIELDEEGIITYGSKDKSKIYWNSIANVEKLNYFDTDSMRVFGLGGIKLQDKSNNKVVIYSTINGYKNLVQDISGNVHINNT